MKLILFLHLEKSFLTWDSSLNWVFMNSQINDLSEKESVWVERRIMRKKIMQVIEFMLLIIILYRNLIISYYDKETKKAYKADLGQYTRDLLAK